MKHRKKSKFVIGGGLKIGPHYSGKITVFQSILQHSEFLPEVQAQLPHPLESKQ